MAKNSGKLMAWIVTGILAGLAGWGLKEAHSALVQRLVATENVNHLQDMILEKFAIDKALDLQWKIAISKNQEAIMNELGISESLRAYVKLDTSKNNR